MSVMLQIGGFGGFSFTDLLSQLESWGFFAYMLPFLLIFALIYAIITSINIFKENKGAAAIVAIAVGLLSLQFNVVPQFFSTIFPNLGVGLSILLAALVLAGVFISEEEKAFRWILFGTGALIFLVVVVASLSSWQFAGSWEWRGWWANYGGIILFLLIITGVVVAVTVAGRHGATAAKPKT